MIIRREAPGEAAAVYELTRQAFGRDDEAQLLDRLRVEEAWIPRLSLVAEAAGHTEILAGHVVCSRAWIDGRPALGLGPVSVAPQHQRAGVGSALVHAVLGAADALDEPIVVLLGHLEYYPRFGFRPARELGILPPDERWGDHFMARPLAAYDPTLRGTFQYAEAFTNATTS